MIDRREVPPVGPLDAKIAIIGEAPGKWEVIHGEPFVGKAGEVLERCLHSAGMIRGEVYLTNVVKVRPGENDNIITPYFTGKGFTEIGQTWVDRLREELSELPVNVFVPMGNTALYALTGLTGIKNVRGSVYPCTLVEGRKVIPTIHPAATLYDKPGAKARNFFDRYLITEDFKKVKRHQDTRELGIPNRNLLVRPTFDQALSYLAAVHQSGTAPFDIETINNQVSCISFAKNTYDAISISFSDYTAERELMLWKAIAAILGDRSVAKLGQNLIFDTQFLFENLGIITRGPIFDTMIAHHILYPELRKSLPVISSIYTDEPYWKDEGKVWSDKQIGRKMGMDNFRIYSAKDSVVLPEIWPQLWEQLEEDRDGYVDFYNHVIECFPSLIYMSVRGVRTDNELRLHLKDRLTAEIHTLRERLNTLAGRELNANSPKQLMQYFYVEKNISPFTSRTSGKATTDDKAMQRLADGTKHRAPMPEAKCVQAIRRAVKQLGTYVDISLDDDQRLRGAMNPVGTVNTRYSSSQLLRGYKKKVGLNMQNVPREIRKFVVADEGRVFFIPDKVQGEWVIVAYICGDSRMIHIVENNLDAHIETAKFITRLPEDYIEAEHDLIGDSRAPVHIDKCRRQLEDSHPEWRQEQLLAANPTAYFPRTYSCRAVGKHSNHGLNYLMGEDRFMAEYEVEPEDAARVVQGYPKAYPGIKTGFWDYVAARMKADRTLYDLYGRKRIFLGPSDDNLLKDALDFMPQSTLARNTQNGQKRIYADQTSFMRQVEILNNMHDGLLMQMPYDNVENLARAILRTQEHLSDELCFQERTFRIKTDFKLGFSWGTTVSFKADSMDQLMTDLPGLLSKAKDAHERVRREALQPIDSAESSLEG